MYGKTVDDFEYRGVLFRWVLSPNRFIYRIYVESALIGTIPVSQVRARMLPSAIEALYPICDAWLKDNSPHLASEMAFDMNPPPHSGEITTEAMAKNRDDDEIGGPGGGSTEDEELTLSRLKEVMAELKDTQPDVLVISRTVAKALEVKPKKKRAAKGKGIKG